MARQLEGQSAIVWGGSGPVGAAVAAALGRAGADVAVHYHRNASAAERVAANLEELGARSLVLQADITEASAVDGLIGEVTAQFGALDIVVNAAHGPFEPIEIGDMAWDDWTLHLDALKGHFLICQSALSVMRQQRRGRIIFLSGGLAQRMFKGFAAYSTVKAGLNAFCKTMACEVGAYGITVNIVAPGKVVPQSGSEAASASWSAIERRQIDAAPLGRYATDEDVAQAVLFFASPAAAGLTGQTLFVAGGEIMP